MSAACQQDGARGRETRQAWGRVLPLAQLGSATQGACQKARGLPRVPALGGRISRSVISEIVKRVRHPS